MDITMDITPRRAKSILSRLRAKSYRLETPKWAYLHGVDCELKLESFTNSLCLCWTTHLPPSWGHVQPVIKILERMENDMKRLSLTSPGERKCRSGGIHLQPTLTRARCK
jgi:hypothetical protein